MLLKLNNMQKYTAEFIATFFLVFAGTGAIIINDLSAGAITHLGIALTFGMVVMSMIYAFGNLSGAHMNPAVTLAFYIAKRFPAKDIAGYLTAQLCGALSASLVLHYLFPLHAGLGATIPSGSDLQSFILEFILSFILLLVVFNVATGSKETGIMAGIAIGSVVGLEALFAGPVCGASMNPFRSLAPAIVSENLSGLWVYLTAPTLGAILAVFVFNYLHKKPLEHS